MAIVMRIRDNQVVYLNILAPKLKGRPRRKRKKRSASPGESSNESEASVASTSRSSTSNSTAKGPSSVVRRSERKTSIEEKKFLVDVQNFMSSRGTPVGKMPLLGYRQIDPYLFYTKVQKLGGYDAVSAGRLWKSIYDDMGGNTGSTSAATITRRHYERLLLPYERHQRGEETKVRPGGRRTKSTSDEALERKPTPPPEPPQPSPPPAPTSPIQKLFSTTSLLPGDKPKTEVKTSSLRSVRVKPERLKSLNTMIASTPSNPPSPPPSSNTSNTSSSSTTPSTTPTGSQSVLERQLNSPLVTQQQPPSPIPHQITNPSAVTLTPPPERELKEMKVDQPSTKTALLAQGKENIPLFGEKPQFEKNPPKSPEVIDLELESDTSRDKIIIPSFKKRKLEILREGGLEVTAVDLDSRPSVIQATITPVTVPCPPKTDERAHSSPSTPNTVPKLISVTVTPDIGHMLPSPGDSHPRTKIHNNCHTANSRVINLGASNNASLLQLYANAGSASTSPVSPGRFTGEQRVLPPKVTQSRSIFAHSEKMVYGNPKDILGHQKYHPTPPPMPVNPGGVLDLTAKQLDKTPFSRPNLEIVRVPVVPRPNPLNLEMKGVTIKEKIPESPRKSPFSYPMLDSRTMASNNLEITLVNPKTKPQQPSPVRNGSTVTNISSVNVNLRGVRQNGKYPVRQVETVTPYSPRKLPSHPVIPNVPNLNHLGSYPPRTPHQPVVDKRLMKNDIREHQMRIESEKFAAAQQQKAQARQDRRHSMPNIPSGFVPSVSHNSGFISQLPNTGKFLPAPMLDPVYYSALCNGLFPPPMPPTSLYVPPGFSAYCSEFLGQGRVPMGQPTVPTSK